MEGGKTEPNCRCKPVYARMHSTVQISDELYKITWVNGSYSMYIVLIYKYGVPLCMTKMP